MATTEQAELSQELKEFIGGQLCLIYECGENRDDVFDNICDRARSLDEKTYDLFHDYCGQAELKYMAGK